jgi:GAF domain-containing protein
MTDATGPGADTGSPTPLADDVRAALQAIARLVAVAGRLEPVAGQAILHAIADATVAIFDAQAASIALHDPVADTLVFRIVAGPAGTGALGLEIGAGQGIAGYVFSTGQPLAVADVTADPRFGRAAAEASGYLPRSILAVPLIDEAGSIGVLEVLDRRDGATFSLRDLDVAAVFARQATSAIRAGRVERDAATLVRSALTSLAGGASVDAALAVALEGLGSGEEDDGFWPLVDVLARIRGTDPDQLALVTEVLEVVARRAPRGHGGGRW